MRGFARVLVRVTHGTLTVGFVLDLAPDCGRNVRALSLLVRPGRLQPTVERQKLFFVIKICLTFNFGDFELTRHALLGRVFR